VDVIKLLLSEFIFCICQCHCQWWVNSSVDITLYSGYSAADVYRQWRESGHIVNWILPWKTNTLSVSPFNHSCIAIRASELDCSYDISLIVARMHFYILPHLSVIFVFLFGSIYSFSFGFVSQKYFLVLDLFQFLNIFYRDVKFVFFQIWISTSKIQIKFKLRLYICGEA